jgi:hypothetical protein
MPLRSGKRFHPVADGAGPSPKRTKAAATAAKKTKKAPPQLQGVKRVSPDFRVTARVCKVFRNGVSRDRNTLGQLYAEQSLCSTIPLLFAEDIQRDEATPKGFAAPPRMNESKKQRRDRLALQEKLNKQRKEAAKLKVHYKKGAWYSMTGAFYTKAMRRTTYVTGRMAVAGSRNDAVCFFMPDSSTFKEAAPFPGDGDEYFLDPDEEEDPNEEWDYSAAARIKRLVAAIKKRGKAPHLCEVGSGGEEWKFVQ